MNSKYLKYAIGEILLVVVGILIALGINNWNEERKQKNLQSQYLSSMLEEFEIFQYDLEFQISQNEMLIEKLSNSIKILDSGSIPNWKLEGEIGVD